MQKVLLTLLRFYQQHISRLLPPACRHFPTCSNYALEAIERYGAARGAALAVARVGRCHPFAKAGFDPVPDLDMRAAHLKKQRS